MKLLITGGAGFIGSNFIHLVRRERPDWFLVNVDALTYAGNLENLQSLEKDSQYKFIKGDITDVVEMEKILAAEKPDALINFAAETHVDRSIHGGAATFGRTNVLGVQNLLELVKNLGLQRFVQVSTDEVYGALSLESTDPFKEETPFAPNSPYAASKASGDLFCRAYFKTYGVPVMVTHCSNNYGPYQFPEKLIPFMTMKALRDEPLPMYGDGKYVRDWIHVDDHCRALLAVLERGQLGTTYNIGADAEVANIEIAKTILSLLGKPESLITYVKDRPGHDRRYAVDSAKIQKELGWMPQFPKSKLADGLAQTVEWYKNHGDWVQRAVDKSKDINAHIR